jgi:hypothetical protein
MISISDELEKPLVDSSDVDNIDNFKAFHPNDINNVKSLSIN